MKLKDLMPRLSTRNRVFVTAQVYIRSTGAYYAARTVYDSDDGNKERLTESVNNYDVMSIAVLSDGSVWIDIQEFIEY